MSPPFLWGVASAYQIEGAVDNDWSAWEAAGRLRARAERCGVATRHRDLWQSDLALLPNINANAYRFSVEWSRLEPRPGDVLVLAHRVGAGSPIQGYLHWSLLDNFEWLDGFAPRFGLFGVDYATFARRRRPSADLFADLRRSVTGPARRAGASGGG
jgi:beta-glucosidase/6-phospho-beta-glucosidase/beta-galactosidase